MKPSSTPRTLVIGGTGMLAGVCTALDRTGAFVLVHGRRPRRVEAVLNRCSDAARGWHADYRGPDFVAEAARQTARHHIERVVMWLHEGGVPTLSAQLAAAFADAGVAQCVQVMSSSAGAVGSDEVARFRAVFTAHRLTWRAVVLGYIGRPGARTRWLSHSEIAAGVLDALHDHRPLSIVGVIDGMGDRGSDSAP